MSTVESNLSYMAPVWPRLLKVPVVRGEGAYVWDVEGKRYLDFATGLGVTNTGHCHPKVVEAIQHQATQLLHMQGNIASNEPSLKLIEGLRKIVPPELDRFFFANTGSEAVEASIKLARQATGRTNIIAFQRGFHGRTIGTMSLTSSKIIYRGGYQPLMAGVFFSPYSYCYRCPVGINNGVGTCDDCGWVLDQVRFLLRSQTAPNETAAILVEPVLGEGGYIVPTPAFIKGLREICDEHGILLILDEIQSGFGRTGRYFAFEHFGVMPDILVIAKGIASGMPLSAIVAREELFELTPVGSHGGTYGGNMVSCAAGVATLAVFEEENLVENSAQLGEVLLAQLKTLQEMHPCIGDVRGLGLMVGTEFVKPSTLIPDKKRAEAVRNACVEMGLLIVTCGTDSNIIRWIPPLTISRDQLQDAIDIFGKAVEQTG
jgi:4-aminobutyrate aminotransferase